MTTQPRRDPPAETEATQDYRPLQDGARPAPAQQPVPLAKPSQPESGRSSGVRKVSVLGDFCLVGKLGSGAMGSVYRARQISTPREAALKVLSKELAGQPDFVRRFQREARLMARLDHPNVLRCYAVGEAHTFHYLAIEYAGGGSVGSWLARLGKFDLPDALCVVVAAARGLGYAHGQNLVHRDVKPDNLLFTRGGAVKVADLGLARATDEGEGLTKTGIALGTPLYAAPEQIHDAKQADARSDIYALGCVLYHLLAGRVPFEAKNLIDLITVKDRGTFVPVRRHRRELPEGVERVLTRMLAKFPEQRYADCGVLIDDLSLLAEVPARPSFFESES